jgi:hypothetical protein
MSGGLVVNCVITNNGVGANCDFGGGVYLSGGTNRNCLIRNNTALQRGGGVCLPNPSSGLIESCTIVSNWANSASDAGGGVYRASGGTVQSTLRNCIVYLNSAPNDTANANWSAPLGFEYSASDPMPPPTTGAGNILAAEPMFNDAAAGNYTLQSGSPCIDAGANQTWMAAPATDLAGNTRKQYRAKGGTRGAPVVDMGAYEAPETPLSGTLIMLR